MRFKGTLWPSIMSMDKVIKQVKLVFESFDKKIIYQRGPRGGGISKAVKPLMHWAAEPWPTLRMY